MQQKTREESRPWPNGWLLLKVVSSRHLQSFNCFVGCSFWIILLLLGTTQLMQVREKWQTTSEKAMTIFCVVRATWLYYCFGVHFHLWLQTFSICTCIKPVQRKTSFDTHSGLLHDWHFWVHTFQRSCENHPVANLSFTLYNIIHQFLSSCVSNLFEGCTFCATLMCHWKEDKCLFDSASSKWAEISNYQVSKAL